MWVYMYRWIHRRTFIYTNGEIINMKPTYTSLSVYSNYNASDTHISVTGIFPPKVSTPVLPPVFPPLGLFTPGGEKSPGGESPRGGTFRGGKALGGNLPRRKKTGREHRGGNFRGGKYRSPIKFLGTKNNIFVRPWHPNAIWCDTKFYAHLYLQHIAHLLC